MNVLDANEYYGCSYCIWDLKEWMNQSVLVKSSGSHDCFSVYPIWINARNPESSFRFFALWLSVSVCNAKLCQLQCLLIKQKILKSAYTYLLCKSIFLIKKCSVELQSVKFSLCVVLHYKVIIQSLLFIAPTHPSSHYEPTKNGFLLNK